MLHNSCVDSPGMNEENVNRDLKCVTKWLNSLMLHSQRRASWKTWIFLELNSATVKGGHSFSGLFKNSHLMDTHYFVHISHLRIHITHRHHKMCTCIFQIQRAITSIAVRHLPLEKSRWINIIALVTAYMIGFNVHAQTCPILCGPSGCSIHGIFQARILEWLPFLTTGDLSSPGIKLMSLLSLALTDGFFTISATREALW